MSSGSVGVAVKSVRVARLGAEIYRTRPAHSEKAWKSASRRDRLDAAARSWLRRWWRPPPRRSTGTRYLARSPPRQQTAFRYAANRARRHGARNSSRWRHRRPGRTLTTCVGSSERFAASGGFTHRNTAARRERLVGDVPAHSEFGVDFLLHEGIVLVVVIAYAEGPRDRRRELDVDVGIAGRLREFLGA